MNMAHTLRPISVCALLLSVVTASPALAQTTWLDPNGGNFNDPNNWTAGVPDPNTDAVFDPNSTYTVTLTQNETSNTILVDGGSDVTLAGNFDYDITSASGTDITGNSTLRLDDVDLNFLTPATDFNHRNGNLFLSNSATLAASGNFNIGFNASSDVTLSGDSDLMTGTVRIFEGTADLSGAGTTWISTDQLGVGRAGGKTGTLNISTGAQVTSVSGLVGNETSSTGNVIIDGTSSLWEVTGISFLIGNLGSADVDITGGGALVTNGVWAGITATGSATIDVDGAGSTWTNTGDIYLGGSDLAAGGTATLNLANGGLASVSGTTKLWSGGTLNLNGGSLTTGSFVADPNGTINHLGGTLTVDAGTFNPGTSAYTINSLTGGTPTLTLTNSASATLSGDLTVAANGNGTLNIENGATVSNFDGFIALDPNSVGTVTVDGVGSTWTNTSGLRVGDGGNGTLNINNGGLVDGGGPIAFDPNSVGTVTVDGAGSTWNNLSGNGLVAFSGNGTLNINNGGSVTNSSGYIGWFPNSVGTVTVNGSDPNGNASSWTNTGDLLVGEGGNGALNIEAGAAVTSVNGSIGDNSTSVSTVTVTDPNSTWANSGDLTVGKAGNGTLNINNGGSVANDNGRIAVDPNSTGLVSVVGAGSNWTNNGEVVIGDNGTGELRIESGGSVVSTRSWIAGSFFGLPTGGSTGDVTVTGSDPNGNASTWTTDEAIVATYGSGTLNIEFGGVVTSNSTSVGRFPGSVGVANVIGSDGSNFSTWNVSSGLTIGSLGNGTLNIQAGADVTSNGGIIGDQPSATGVVTVVGFGSTWTNSSSLVIGNLGNATLNVQSGAAVTNSTGIIANVLNSTGVVTVVGFGSTWTNSSSLTIGGSGNGTLNIQTGGVVTNNSGTIGDDPNSIGAVTVTGAGSTWTNSGGLFVGNEGVGTLNINSSGLVTVADTTNINSSSSVLLGGGRFEFGTTDPNSYGRISGTSGELAGEVLLSGFNAISSIDFTIPNLDVSGVLSANTGVIYGSGVVVYGLVNQPTGELRTLSGEWARFGGVGNTNAGEVNNFGGVVEFENDFTNEATGFVAGRGQFIAGTGWTNHGVMAFSGGPAEVLGDVTNSETGQIAIGGTSVTTFYDDVTMDPNNLNINVAASGTAVFLGSYNGGNDGTGAVEVLGDLRPGNSPALVSFGGDLSLGSGADTFIELGGLLTGEFDALDITGDFDVTGELMVSLLGGFTLDTGMEFLIADVDGTVSGMFDGLADGDLVGNYGGVDLFIDYDAGDGNDIALFTAGLTGDFDNNGRVDGFDFLAWQRDTSLGDLADWQANYGMSAPLSAAAAVPEPATTMLSLAVFCLIMTSRRSI